MIEFFFRKQNDSSVTARQDEAGVFVPLVAIMGTSLLAVIFVVGFNSVLMRRGTALFRDRAEQSCKIALDHKDFVQPARAAAAFAGAVNVQFAPGNLTSALSGGRFVLTRAELTIPTMPADARFSITSGTDGAFSSVNESCGVVSGGSCTIRGEVYPRGASPMPKGVMHPRADAHGTVGCVFEGTLRVFNFLNVFGGGGFNHEAPMRAVYSYWRPVNGVFLDYDPGSSIDASGDFIPSASGIAPENVPGLTVAISTHLQANPANGFVHPALGLNATGTTFSHSNNFTAMGIQSAPAYSSGSVVSGHPYSPAYELAVNCFNPATQARNVFLVTLLQLAARHGQLRSSTELLHIGTTDRWFDNSAIGSGDNGSRNAPWLMVPFGSDLLWPDSSAAYQLPYVYYDSGGGPSSPADWATPPVLDTNFTPPTIRQGINSVNSDYGYTTFGPINPSSSGAPSRLEWRPHHSTISNQLRMCANLYKEGAGFIVADTPMYNTTYEPNELIDSNASWSGAVFSNTAAFNTLDQRISGGTGLSSGRGLSMNAGTDAISLVGMLGSTQACPFRDPNMYSGAPLFFSNGGDTSCQKPADDLRPDVFGLFQYLRRNNPINAIEIVTNRLSAIRERNISNPAIAQPFANVSAPVNSSTSIVLVLHRVPPNAELAKVQALVEGMNFRSIIVVFIPENQAELNRVGDLQDSFRAHYDGNLPLASCTGSCFSDFSDGFRNKVLVFDPRDADGVSFCSGTCSANHFRNYWLEMIQPGLSGGGTTIPADAGAGSVAVEVFNILMKPAERKY